jgi:LPXTG-motif cell wall-anchored protein
MSAEGAVVQDNSRSVAELPDFREELADLQTESIKPMSLLTGVIGYLWLIWVLLPETGGESPGFFAWFGSSLFALSAGLSYGLKNRSLRVASALLVWGTLIATTCGVLSFQSPGFVYLLILPITFANVLLDQRAVAAIVIIVIAFTLVIGTARAEGPLLTAEGMSPVVIDIVVPPMVITLVALASQLSARNLHTALAWVWNGYELAHSSELMVRKQAGELRRALKSLDEATHRLERTNYMLALARDQADEARRLKQQFVQTISHELRTPLNLIVGFTELMAETPGYYGAQLTPAYLRDLSIVYRNACHLQDLVNDVLDLARIEAVQMTVLPEEIDPTVLVQEALNTVRNLVESRGLTLEAEIGPDLPPLWVDPTRIRQVLFNLLNNAVRFTENGGITVSVCSEGEEVIFAVADTGVGIAPEYIDRIFEEFQQADGSTRRRHGGAGLGLAISQRFVELHNGRIWVESQVGHGSTFYFSLPAGRTDLVKASSDHVQGSKQAVATGPVSAKGSEEPVLLAVTRSLSAATLLTRYVNNCRTVAVSDLEEARHAARSLMPQAVIVDRMCEEIDSPQLEALARELGLTHIPFVACPLPGEAPLCQRLAVNGYLVKPVSRQGVWDVIRRFGKDVDSVLVVDDDRDFVRLLSRILEDSPVRRYRVIGAYSGQQALVKIRQRQPDLVLLDLGLPDMDGSQLVERVRSNPEWQHVPIVIVSAHGETDSLKILEGGVSISRADGLMPGEVVRWVQHVVDTTVTTLPAP